MTKEEAKKFLRENGFCETHGVRLCYRVRLNSMVDYSPAYEREAYCPACEREVDEAKWKQYTAIDKKAEQARRVLGIC